MSLKKSVAKEEVVETQETEVVEDNKSDDVASVDTINQVVDICRAYFGLGSDYAMTSYVNKGTNIKVTLASRDFEVAVTIKDPQAHGIM